MNKSYISELDQEVNDKLNFITSKRDFRCPNRICSNLIISLILLQQNYTQELHKTFQFSFANFEGEISVEPIIEVKSLMICPIDDGALETGASQDICVNVPFDTKCIEIDFELIKFSSIWHDPSKIQI